MYADMALGRISRKNSYTDVIKKRIKNKMKATIDDIKENYLEKSMEDVVMKGVEITRAHFDGGIFKEQKEKIEKFKKNTRILLNKDINTKVPKIAKILIVKTGNIMGKDFTYKGKSFQKFSRDLLEGRTYKNLKNKISGKIGNTAGNLMNETKNLGALDISRHSDTGKNIVKEFLQGDTTTFAQKFPKLTKSISNLNKTGTSALHAISIKGNVDTLLSKDSGDLDKVSAGANIVKDTTDLAKSLYAINWGGKINKAKTKLLKASKGKLHKTLNKIPILGKVNRAKLGKIFGKSFAVGVGMLANVSTLADKDSSEFEKTMAGLDIAGDALGFIPGAGQVASAATSAISFAGNVAYALAPKKWQDKMNYGAKQINDQFRKVGRFIGNLTSKVKKSFKSNNKTATIPSGGIPSSYRNTNYGVYPGYRPPVMRGTTSNSSNKHNSSVNNGRFNINISGVNKTIDEIANELVPTLKLHMAAI